jgi:mannose-6-phosphate isomerase-like protein (cupin superfamily)
MPRPAGSPIISDLVSPADVYGVHGAAGLSRWKCLARPPRTRGTWEAVEWAWLPAGGVSGEHLHTRTEELYLLIGGHGRVLLNGVPRDVGPGELILTPVGARHGLRNDGAGELSWLVVEVRAPATAAAYAAAAAGEIPKSPSRRGDSVPVVVNLRERGEFDPRTVLTGPLAWARIVVLTGGREERLIADGVEHTVFVLAGVGTATSGETVVDLAAGGSVTLPMGAEVTLAGDGLEFFHAGLTVEMP